MKHSNQETGHDKNLSNFHALVQFCEALGTAYQPSRDDITLVALHNAYANGKALLDQLHQTESLLSQGIVSRQNAFENLATLATQVLNLLRACKPGSEVLRLAQHYSKKLHKRRIGKEEAPATDAGGETTAHKKISAIQSSFDAQLSQFEQLVRIAENEPAYAPNEVTLKLDTLHSVVNRLAELNQQVVHLTHQRRLLIAERQQAFYSPSVGLVAWSQAVRAYVSAIYGVHSKQEKAANAFLLRRLNK